MFFMSTDRSDSSQDQEISGSDLDPSIGIQNLREEVERVLQDNGFTYAEGFSEYMEGEFLVPLGSDYSSVTDYAEGMENVGVIDAPRGKAYYLLEE